MSPDENFITLRLYAFNSDTISKGPVTLFDNEYQFDLNNPKSAILVEEQAPLGERILRYKIDVWSHGEVHKTMFPTTSPLTETRLYRDFSFRAEAYLHGSEGMGPMASQYMTMTLEQPDYYTAAERRRFLPEKGINRTPQTICEFRLELHPRDDMNVKSTRVVFIRLGVMS